MGEGLEGLAAVLAAEASAALFLSDDFGVKAFKKTKKGSESVSTCYIDRVCV